jgi:phosphonate transport system substrate-binding protein
MTGLTFGIQFGTSFGASIESMGAGKAQVGFLNTFSVLLAEAKYGIVPVLANERAYATVEGDPDAAMKDQLEPFYKAEFLANSASGIKSFADLKGKTFCFVDPNSTSGYIVPRIILKAHGFDPDKDFKATVNAGSHPNVAIAVYKGDCDAGVAYIDIRTDATANLAATYPDIMTKVQVFAVSDRIPNDGVQVVKDFPADYTAALTEALLSMNGDPGGNALIKNLYNVNKFIAIDKTFYDPFAAVLKAAGVDPSTMVK